MSTEQQLLLWCVGAVIALGTYGIYALFRRSDADRVKDRLHADAEASSPGFAAAAMPAALSRLSEAVGKPLEPKDPEERSKLRRELGYAGFYSPSAVRLFLGAKIIGL